MPKKAGIKVSKKGIVTIPKNCKDGMYYITISASGSTIKYNNHTIKFKKKKVKTGLRIYK